MEEQYDHEFAGQAVSEEDINLISENAARADDRVFGTLITPGVATKNIIPLGDRGLMIPLVRPKPAADSKVLVGPFRAYLGSTIFPQAGGGIYLRETNSAIYSGTSAIDDQSGEVSISATVSNNRWDLIYARIDRYAPTPNVTRPVKTSTGTTTITTSVSMKSVVTVAVVTGAESAIPTLPSTPSDAGGSFYIPLAYVRLQHPHTANTQIPATRILEVARILALNRRLGASTIQPLSCQYDPAGPIMTSVTAGIGVSGVLRPKAFIPATMLGKEERIVALGFNGSTTQRSIPLNATTTLDSSQDWRGRFFVSEWFFLPGTGDFSWNGYTAGPSAPWPSSTPVNELGQTIYRCPGTSMNPLATSYDGISGAGPIAKLTSANLSAMASGASLTFYVDLAFGNLMVRVGATDPNGHLIGIISAIGMHPNRA